MSGGGGLRNGRECGEDAAAYVLGSLEPAEAEAFRRHLAGCTACQQDVAELEQVTGSLADATVRYEVPRDLRRRVLSEVRATPKARGEPAGAGPASGRRLGWRARRGGCHRRGRPRGRARLRRIEQ